MIKVKAKGRMDHIRKLEEENRSGHLSGSFSILNPAGKSYLYGRRG